MSIDVTIEELLRWRLAIAEAEAPPGPCVAELLTQARPWWERDPMRFQRALQSVMAIKPAVDDATAQTARPRAFDSVTTLIVRADQQTQACVGVLYFNLG